MSLGHGPVTGQEMVDWMGRFFCGEKLVTQNESFCREKKIIFILMTTFCHKIKNRPQK